MDLGYNNLLELPDSIGSLTTLEKLDVHENPRLRTVSPKMKYLTNLRKVKFEWSNITYLPPGIGRKMLKNGTNVSNPLNHLTLDGNNYLRNFPVSLADAPLERVTLWGTKVCDGETPMLDPAFEHMSNLSATWCCPKALGQKKTTEGRVK